MEKYTLNEDEMRAVETIRNRYMWSEIVSQNLEGNVLILDNMTQHEITYAIDEEGLPLLDERTGLFLFLITLEPV